MMGAVLMRLRTEARARWRAWLALAVLLGVIGGSSMAAAAGARRTASAYERFVAGADAYDVIFGGFTADHPDPERAIADIAAMPEVESWTRTQFVAAEVELPSGRIATLPEIFVMGDRAGKDGVTVNRANVLRGRMPDPAAPDEARIGFQAAESLGVDVGDRLMIRLFDPVANAALPVPVTITGVVLVPGDFPAIGATAISSLFVTPAFFERWPDNTFPPDEGPWVNLREGVDAAAWAREVERMVPIDSAFLSTQHLVQVGRSQRFEVFAMWLLAGLLGLAGLAIVGQAIARQIFLESADNETLRAVGMSRTQLRLMGVARALLVSIGGAMLAVPVALLGSMLTPIGLGAIAEPDPGYAFDGPVTGIGVAAIVVVVLLVSAWPSWRASSPRQTPAAPARPSMVALGLARTSASLPLVAGSRLALEAGRGARAVPVRTAVLGVAIGVAALAASLGFAASLDRFVGDPRLSGFNWDLVATVFDDAPGADIEPTVRADPDVEAYSRGGVWELRIGSGRLFSFVSDPTTGIEPVVLEGRAATAAGEIALGAGVMRRVGLSIGDEVQVHASGTPEPRTMRVVGTVVVPSFFFESYPPGESAAMTTEALGTFGQGTSGAPVVIRFKDGVDLNDKLESYRARSRDLFVLQRRQPTAEMVSLGRVARIPLVLAGFLGLLSAATLLHTLISAIRRRRHDIAIFKTIGFVRRQARLTIAWQATILTVIALFVSLPIGVIAGRWGWRAFARDLAVLEVTVTPLVLLGIVALLALVLANLIAAFPARAAARTEPALILRSE